MIEIINTEINKIETFIKNNIKKTNHQNLCKMEAPCFSYGEEIL